MDLPRHIRDEIEAYCRLNSIDNFNEFLISVISKGFTLEKYGPTPSSKITEKIVEKIVEIPVEKKVFITNDEELNKITNSLNEANVLNDALKITVQNLEKENTSLKEELIKLKKQKDIYGE